MPLTITKSYEDGRLVNIERLYSNDYASGYRKEYTPDGRVYSDRNSSGYRKNYTPDEYIDFLEKQVWTMEKKNGRIVKVYH